MNRKDFISAITFSLSSVFDKSLQCIIHTNRVCDRCKLNLGRNIVFERGVKDVLVNVEKKLITIKYDASKNTPEKLKKYIVSIGFDADEIKADIYKREIIRDCCLMDVKMCK
jgi:periplasmic mercuric ion binding protein